MPLRNSPVSRRHPHIPDIYALTALGEMRHPALMKRPRRAAMVAVLLLGLGAAGLIRQQGRDASRPAAGSVSSPVPPPPKPGPARNPAPSAPLPLAASPATPLTPEQQEIERHKEIDRDHLAKLRSGILAWKAKYGQYPEYLTQLVPEFVSAETLVSPHKKAGSEDFADLDHPDPGLEKPSYGYEFSNLEFRDGRTFAEIKEVQRAEWGDAIPLLRCFAYDKVMNMAFGGDVYETALNWEWDAATMDLVDKYGWGPGLKSGEMVKVRVTGADGQPAANAQVWADGRNYSFDLPNRPFPTDAAGWATIPVGADIDRTALVLRAEIPGQSSALTRYPAGQLPAGQTLVMGNSETVGGTALDANGAPMPHARVYLKAGPSDPAGEWGFSQNPTITTAVSDATGHWQAAVNPADLPGLSAMIGVPGGTPVNFGHGPPLDPAAAKAGTAEVRVPGRE